MARTKQHAGEEEPQRGAKENSYLLNLVRTLLPYDRTGLPRSIVMARIRQAREANGHSIPETFEASVRRAFGRHSSESRSFTGARKDDLFFWVGGKAGGRWAVRRKPALAWLRKQSFRIS